MILKFTAKSSQRSKDRSQIFYISGPAIYLFINIYCIHSTIHIYVLCMFNLMLHVLACSERNQYNCKLVGKSDCYTGGLGCDPATYLS